MSHRSASPAFRTTAALGVLACLLAPSQARADVTFDTIFTDGFDPCVGVQCAQVECPAGQTTSVSGTVYMPNGTLPLPNVVVYVPSTTPGALVDGPAYDRCGAVPSGHPVAIALTDADGNFTINNVPATTNVPLVMLAGKWRRQITVPNVPQCVNTPVATTDTRLPKTHLEGDIPLTAITTGNADSLECLMRKTGVADSEFGSNAGSARIQLFFGNGVASIAGSPATPLSDATTLWASTSSLSAYDQVMLACEGNQNPATKPQTAIDALKAYADAGGRVYLAHLQNIWIAGASDLTRQGAWPAVATWNFNLSPFNTTIIGHINNTFPQGLDFYSWLVLVGASAPAGTLSILSGRQTAIAIDPNVARSWVYLTTTSNNFPSVQYFSFTTPVESGAELQQGRVLFTDMHPASGDQSPTNGVFPNACTTSAANPQEKALLYAAFDLQRCVGSTKE
jgi:hypothetical protein